MNRDVIGTIGACFWEFANRHKDPPNKADVWSTKMGDIMADANQQMPGQDV